MFTQDILYFGLHLHSLALSLDTTELQGTCMLHGMNQLQSEKWVLCDYLLTKLFGKM